MKNLSKLTTKCLICAFLFFITIMPNNVFAVTNTKKVSAVDGKVTVTFTNKLTTTPKVTDFVVTQVINNGASKTVSPTKVTMDSTKKIVILAVPVIAKTTVVQNVVYKVSYKKDKVVNSQALVITKAVAKPVVETKTITFNSYDSKFVHAPVTVQVTNVTAQTTKDFSMYLSDDKKTIAGKKSIVLNCTAPTTITLQPNKGVKNVGVFSFSMSYDGNKVPVKSVKTDFKYYAFDVDTNEFDFSKKLTKPTDSCGYADGSTQTLTKAGTYVLNVKSVNNVDDTTAELTPVFIVVK